MGKDLRRKSLLIQEKKRLIQRVNQVNLGSSKITWKGTPGVGDFMYGLNVAYFRSWLMTKPIHITFEWYHDEDFLYHFEDPETIIERFKYIEKFYKKKNARVSTDHVFNSTDGQLYKSRFFGYSTDKVGAPRLRDNTWLMRDGFRHDNPENIIPKKIVVWRETFNAQQPRRFKRTYDHETWHYVFGLIEEQGYTIQEIDYRTPIREAMYHIRTAQCCLCYEGMWHYIAKNMFKPMIVLARDKITKFHTPNALIFDGGPPDKEFSTRFWLSFDRRIHRAEVLAKKNFLIGLADED